MKAIRHTGIVVNDMNKMLHFYKDILGLKIKKENIESGEYVDTVLGLKNTKIRIIKMAAEDGNLIELLHYGYNVKKPTKRNIHDPGYSHISFTVNDLDSKYRSLKEKGVKFISRAQISSDKKVKIVFCQDPEGNFIELVEDIN